MTTRYTNAEWDTIIRETEGEVLYRVASKQTASGARCPPIGSEAFTKTIDHTLLKLEAKPSQFDDLCAEARVDRFAVCVFFCRFLLGRCGLTFLQTVCVRVQYVQQCVADLKGSGVKVACVIGFHEGTYDLYHKSQ